MAMNPQLGTEGFPHMDWCLQPLTQWSSLWAGRPQLHMEGTPLSGH